MRCRRCSFCTIDAIGCQKSIAGQLHEHGADYVLSLKGNQRHMFNVCKKHFESAEADRGQQTFSDSDKGHGRIETRKYQVSALPPRAVGARPRAARQGSIYENQKAMPARYF